MPSIELDRKLASRDQHNQHLSAVHHQPTRITFNETTSAATRSRLDNSQYTFSSWVDKRNPAKGLKTQARHTITGTNCSLVRISQAGAHILRPRARCFFHRAVSSQWSSAAVSVSADGPVRSADRLWFAGGRGGAHHGGAEGHEHPSFTPSAVRTTTARGNPLSRRPSKRW